MNRKESPMKYRWVASQRRVHKRNCMSRMRWKAHVRFLGGENLRGSTYPKWVTKLTLDASIMTTPITWLVLCLLLLLSFYYVTTSKVLSFYLVRTKKYKKNRGRFSSCKCVNTTRACKSGEVLWLIPTLSDDGKTSSLILTSNLNLS